MGVCRTGEASPYYIFHPHAGRRIGQILPDVRIVVLLRNPVDRAVSHYHHEVRRGRETLTFEEAIEREPERLAGEVDRMLTDDGGRGFNHRRHSYLSRGRYIEQLPAWYEIFPTERLLILRSEDLFADPAATVTRVYEWLGLPPAHGGVFRSLTRLPTARWQSRLDDGFRTTSNLYNRRLAEFLGRDMHWNA